MHPGRRSFWRASVVRTGLIACVVLYAACLRGCRLDEGPLWTDEAETAINALTILADGVPSSQYNGQPIFENTLVEPWPDHPEYEFRDSSYSHRGVAIYHGWLPLYVTALSLWAFDVPPDSSSVANPPPPRSFADLNRRTLAARLPGVLFGIVFVALIYRVAFEVYGADAAWAALCAAAVSTSAILLSRQVRYYSGTLALNAFCGLMLVRIVERGRRRDFAFGGVGFALMFHTNAMALSGLAAGLAACAPLLLRQPKLVAKFILLAAPFALGVLPWVVATGFVDAAVTLPAARTLLGRAEVIDYLWRRWPFVAVAMVTVAWLVFIRLFHERLPERIQRPFLHSRPIFVALAASTTGAFLAFNLLTPAASYFQSRLSLILLVPALMFGATLFAAIARVITHHRSPLLASAMFLLVLALAGKVTLWWPRSEPGVAPLFEVVQYLQRVPLERGTRIYGDTGTALPLAFYTGLPVQNVMPIRRTFLDSYEGELIIVESPSAYPLLEPEIIEHFAEHGVVLNVREARRLSRVTRDYAIRAELLERGASVCTTLPDPPPDLAELQALQATKTVQGVADAIAENNNPMFKGFRMRTYTEMWQVFFYRFVDPESRMGARLNYAARVRGATAAILHGGWVVLHSPPGGTPGAADSPLRSHDCLGRDEFSVRSGTVSP